MPKRILFLANDIGGGLGHVRRAVRIAGLLNKGEWEPAILYHNTGTVSRIPTGLKTIHVPLKRERYYVKLRALFSPVHFFPQKPLPGEPYFWEFASLNYQVLRDGYFTRSLVKSRFRRICRIISRWKPDLLIGDGHLLTSLIGKQLGVPVVQVIRAFVFPEKPDFLWWKETPLDLIPPPSLWAFEEVFNQLKIEIPGDASGLLKGDAYLIPGLKLIEPIETEAPHLYFGYKLSSLYDPRLQNLELKKHTKKIYITVGGGAWKSHLSELYQFLLKLLQTFDVQIIISDPFNVLEGEKRWRDEPDIEIFRWIESSTIFPNLDLIIHHGGYNTTLESLWWGVLSIILPFHSEQEGNGRRLEQLGAGKLFPVATQPYRTIEFKSYCGDFTMRGGFGFGLKKESVLRALEEILSGDKHKQESQRLSESLKKQFNSSKLHTFLDNIREI